MSKRGSGRERETETTVCGCEECWKFTTLHKNVQAKLLKLIAINISGPPRAGLNFFAPPVECVRARQTGSGGKREREIAWGGRLVWGCRRLIEHVVGCCSLQLKLKLGEQQRPLGTLRPPPSPPHTPHAAFQTVFCMLANGGRRVLLMLHMNYEFQH